MAIKKRFFTQKVVGHQNRLHRAVVTAPRLPELQERLDNQLRHSVGLLGCPVQGQELVSMILVERIFHYSIL